MGAVYVLGNGLAGKVMQKVQGSFGLRVKMGEYEVEITGVREEVLETINELPELMVNVHKAFESVKPKAVATLTVKREMPKEEANTQKYPRVAYTENCDEAVLRVLETEWGKWRPRTVEELKEALKTNNLDCSGRIFAGVLMGLVRQGKVRRWKTDAGTVYILAEKEALG